MAVARLRQVLDGMDDNGAEVIVDLAGTYCPVDGASIRYTAELGTQLVGMSRSLTPPASHPVQRCRGGTCAQT